MYPNIEGQIANIHFDTLSMTKAFKVTSANSNRAVGYSSSAIITAYVYMDSSLCNALYGRSNTVQPESYKVTYLIKF